MQWMTPAGAFTFLVSASHADMRPENTTLSSTEVVKPTLSELGTIAGQLVRPCVTLVSPRQMQ